MRRADELFDLITKWEQEKRTEIEIVGKFSEMLNEDYDDIDLFFDINDALYWKGYSYQFAIPKEKKEEWDEEEYAAIVKNTTKSKDLTKELCIYLHEMDDWRLTLASLHFIKLKHIISLGYIKNCSFLATLKNENLYDLYMMCFSNIYDEALGEKEAIKLILEEFLNKIGMRYVNLNYMQFRMYMEYLLWTISKVDKAKESFKKINTIKVAFCITPREFYMWNDKIYFNEDIHKNLIKYLSLIDKNESKRIYDMYSPSINELDDTGYKLLFNML